MADEKKGLLYGLLPVAGAAAVLLIFWTIGKMTALLCGAFYAAGWVTHKHRAYAKAVAGKGLLYAKERIIAWTKA